MILAIFGYYVIGPVMEGVLAFLSGMALLFLIDHKLLPLVGIFIEPKQVVLFLTQCYQLR